jgi:hypothetical protein
MSNQMSNAPMMPASGQSFFQTWMDALTKPSERTYATIASSPRAKATTAYLWVFFAAVVQFVLSVLVQAGAVRRVLEERGFGQNLPAGGLGFGAVAAICGGPILAVLAVVGFAVGTALIQWIAKMFGGKGTFDQLAYTFGAIYAPFAILSGVFILLGAIPFVGICFRIVIGLAGFYALFLQITAAKGVNQFGWGPAAGSVLLPGLALAVVCCCMAFIVGTLTGAAIGNIFSSINQSLAP